MAKKKKGKIIIVAKTGGLKFEDEPEKWYNPTNTAKPYVTTDLKNKFVEITLGDNEKNFSYINIIKEEEITEEKTNLEGGVVSKENYWGNREQREITNSLRISRHGAINSAIDLLRLHKEAGGSIDLLQLSVEDRVKVLADKLLKWINQT